MLSLGMRLPMKSRGKTRTLHACVWCVLCDLMNCYVMVCMPCYMYDDGLCAGDQHKDVLENKFRILQCVNWNEEKKIYIFLDSSSSFELEQIGFCGILENYSSFRTRKKSCN